MTNIWFTADHHFGHENIIKYVNRPFKDAAHMDAELIERWNSKVAPEDTVYYLGDFTLSNNAYPYIEQLNGNIKFIFGGHDYKWWPLSSEFILLDWKHELLEPLVSLELPEFTSNGKFLPVVLCHYPLLSWDRSHYGSIHLHGHTHGTTGKSANSGDTLLPPKNKGGANGIRIDVGVDCHNYFPVSIKKIKELNNG